MVCVLEGLRSNHPIVVRPIFAYFVQCCFMFSISIYVIMFFSICFLYCYSLPSQLVES